MANMTTTNKDTRALNKRDAQRKDKAVSDLETLAAELQKLQTGLVPALNRARKAGAKLEELVTASGLSKATVCRHLEKVEG